MPRKWKTVALLTLPVAVAASGALWPRLVPRCEAHGVRMHLETKSLVYGLT
ncbi:hypothetical protein IAD21_03341 [Abditibacteriota bacterium]|nr:hypothetical protein IAD21_03341 [Abditibacteriota bacterium]